MKLNVILTLITIDMGVKCVITTDHYGTIALNVILTLITMDMGGEMCCYY